MSRRGRKKSNAGRGGRRAALTYIRRLSTTSFEWPLSGIPGFIVAALPLALVVGLAWTVPGFWQVPAVVAGGGVVGVVILRMEWSPGVKTAAALAVVAVSALAFTISSDVAPFVFPVILLGFGASLLRARALERDVRDRDAWRDER